jgi:HEPN domain-containing protein
VVKGLSFPYTHDIHTLLTILGDHGVKISENILQAERLSVYAVQTRYPGFHFKIEENHYKQAVSLAEEVLFWAEKIINDTINISHFEIPQFPKLSDPAKKFSDQPA